MESDNCAVASENLAHFHASFEMNVLPQTPQNVAVVLVNSQTMGDEFMVHTLQMSKKNKKHQLALSCCYVPSCET